MAIWRNKIRRSSGVSMLMLAMMILCSRITSAQARNSCLDCHSVLPDELGVGEEKFSHDIHAQKGLTCVSCHGGDANSDDPEESMGKKAGFKKISRVQVPQLC